MRNPHRLVLLPLGLLVLALAGCWGEITRDGAGCSEKATCPPGQICSSDGQCLFPCPTPDCVGEACGCKPHGDYDQDQPGGGQYLCFPDGLCHIKCDEFGDCFQGGLLCGANGTCLPVCNDEHGGQSCPNGATCVMAEWSSYCQGGSADGGVAGDAGICTECPDFGCVYLSVDPAHCGRCRHDCQGGTCEGGECQPKPLAYGPELDDGAAMVISGSDIYWTVRESQAVYACPSQGCASPTLVCVGPSCGTPTALAVTPGAVTWIDEHGGDARILSCPLSGCTAPPTVLAEGLGRATSLAHDESLLYFSSSTGIQRCPEADCGDYIQELHGADLSLDTVSLAVGWETLVFSSFADGAVRICPKAGCVPGPALLEEDPGSLPASVTIDSLGDSVYWVAHSLGEVHHCPLSGCDPSPGILGAFVSGEPWSHLTSLTFLGDALYVLDADRTLRHCAFEDLGNPCAELAVDGLPVLTLVAGPASVILGVADGRILSLAPP